MAMKRINSPFELKAVKSDGTFEGVASPYGELDAGMDIVMPGAFAESLAEFERKNRKVPMLWQHNTREPIGVYTKLEDRKDSLYVHGACNMKVQRGVECHALMDQGALTGLSIGYDPEQVLIDQTSGVRQLIKLDLWEISPVTFPMADSARIALVKSIEEADSLSDCEALLRDAGFSKSEALAFVSRVNALAKNRRDAEGPSVDEIQRAFAILNN